MLATRILSALVLAPVVVLAVWRGGVPFALLVAGAALWCGLEYSRLLERGGFRPAWPIVLAGAFGLVLAPALPGTHLGALALAATILAPGVYFLAEGSPPQRVLHDWSLTVVGTLLIGWPFAQALALRLAPGPPSSLFGLELERGAALVLAVLTCTWASDTGAYAVGRAFGRRPFFAWISPRKTREGAVAGVLAPCLLAIVWAGALGWPIVFAAVLGASIGVAAIAGDLLVSTLKRAVGAKDAGTLIPGHGGLLDRVDSLLLVLAASALLTGEIWP